MIYFFIFLFSIKSFALQLDQNFVTKKAQCKPQDSSHRVYILKQWHLPPAINTFANPKMNSEQLQNQRSLYLLLAQMLDAKQKFVLLAEGCDSKTNSEINIDFKPEFNGWSVTKLKDKSADPTYPEIISSVPMKVEAKYGNNVQTLCADDIALVKEHNLAFSDARGSVGFLMRLDQYKNNQKKLDEYLRAAQEAYHLNKETKLAEVRKKIIEELGTAIDKVNQLFLKRNQHFVTEIEKWKEDVVLVIGGAHATQLKDLLEKKKLSCEVWEPKGYKQEDENLLADLNKAYQGLK